jgi:VWFA-related protein
MRARVFCLLAAGLFGVLAAVVEGQDQRPVFRSSLDLEQIDVSVLDGRRQPVTGLTAADFTVLVDGQARPVKGFAAVTLPPKPAVTDATAVWASTVPPDVVTNQVGEEDGRLVIILMDRTIPPGEPTVTARKIAEATVNELGPHDMAAIVSTSGGVPQTFTSDRTRLLKALDQRDWSTDMSQESKDILDALSAESVGQSLAPDPLSDGRCLCGVCVLDTISRLADAVRGATGRRKVLFFIGSSLIVQAATRDPSLDVGCDRLLRDARNTMFDALAKSSMTINSLDPIGLQPSGPETRAGTPGGFDRPGNPASSGPSQRRGQQQAEVNQRLGDQESLGILPQKTGGRRVINTNAPEDQVPEILHETDSYYVLAYEPDPAARGTTHTIEVKVDRKGAHVYTQSRMAAAPAPAPATGGAAPALAAPAVTLDDALGGLLPMASRPLAMNLAAVAGVDDARPTVNIRVDALSFLEGRTTSAPLDVGVVALDAFARKVASARQTSTVTLVGNADAGRPPEAPVESRLDLAPGDYEIRVAVRDSESGAVSSVFAPITVPAFGDAPLSLSDMTIEAAPAPPVAPQPTIRRAFKSGEQVQAVLRVYEGLERDDAMVPVSMAASILDASGRAIHDETRTLTELDFTRRRSEVRFSLPVDQLPPGAYLLRVQASGGGAAALKAVRFAVESR